MSTKRTPRTGIQALLHGEQVRRVEREGRTLFAAVDVVADLVDTVRPGEYWAELKQREPALALLVEPAEFPAGPGMLEMPVVTDAVDTEGLLRLIQSMRSAKAERLRRWLAATARERLEEAENPELAVLRTRRLYEQKGYSRRWVDKRLRGVSARHELTGEWFKRGATESDQYPALTNEIVQGAFGMDVEGYRQFKNLFKTGENLRDHMTDLELALTALGETVAVALHRDRDSQGFDRLVEDAKDAGEVVAKTRAEIEGRVGHPVVEPDNHRNWWSGGPSRRRRAGQPAAGPRPVEAVGSVDVETPAAERGPAADAHGGHYPGQDAEVNAGGDVDTNPDRHPGSEGLTHSDAAEKVVA